ncbi:hypothetical protein HK104_005678, partial [Borealophlyctis nickersoniae]
MEMYFRSTPIFLLSATASSSLNTPPLQGITRATIDVGEAWIFIGILLVVIKAEVTGMNRQREIWGVLLGAPAAAGLGAILEALAIRTLRGGIDLPLVTITQHCFGSRWVGTLIACPILLTVNLEHARRLVRVRRYWRDAVLLLTCLGLVIGIPYIVRRTSPTSAYSISKWAMYPLVIIAGLKGGTVGLCGTALVAIMVTGAACPNINWWRDEPDASQSLVKPGTPAARFMDLQISTSMLLALGLLVVVLRSERDRAIATAESAMKYRAKRVAKERNGSGSNQRGLAMGGSDSTPVTDGQMAVSFLNYLCRELRRSLGDVVRMSESLFDDEAGGGGQTTEGHNPNETYVLSLSARSIKRLSEHALALTNDAHELIAMGSGKLQLNPVTTDLHAILETSCAEAKTGAAGTRKVELQAVFGTELPQWVLMDHARFKRILDILIMNACKFAPGRTKVSLDANLILKDDPQSPRRDTSLQAQITVTVPEWTIDSKQAEILLHPYAYQASSSADLSLAVAEGLARLMGGELSIKGKPGKGTAFTFTVPLKPEPVPPAPRGLPSHNIRLHAPTKTPTRTLSEILLERKELADTSAGVASHIIPLDPCIIETTPATTTDEEGWKGGTHTDFITFAKGPPSSGIEKAAPTLLLERNKSLLSLRRRSLAPDMTDDHPVAAASTAVSASGSPSSFTRPKDAASVVVAAPESPKHETPTEPKAYILIVDDSSINRAILVRILKYYPQFIVHETGNGADAIEKCMSTAYALICMDLEMPIMGGQEATRRLRGSGFEAPIIVTTANLSKAEDDNALRQFGVTEVLTKPITRQKVADVLTRYGLIGGGAT